MQEMTFDENGRRTYVLPDGTVIARAWRNVLNGMIPLTELDDEELSKAALRGKDGKVNAGSTKLIPRALADQRTRMLMSRVQEQFTEVAMKASQAFIAVIEDDNAEHRDKMAAARYLHERFLGKVPDKVEVQAEVKPWEGLVAGVLREVPDDEQDAEAASPSAEE